MDSPEAVEYGETVIANCYRTSYMINLLRELYLHVLLPSSSWDWGVGCFRVRSKGKHWTSLM